MRGLLARRCGLYRDGAKIGGEPVRVSGYPRFTVHFQVEKTFKGSAAKEVTTEALAGSCDYNLVVGQKYLVYANHALASGGLELKPCTRTTLLANADADLAYINSLNGKGGQSASGLIIGLSEGDMKNVKLLIAGEQTGTGASINKWGRYSIDGISIGEHRIQLVFPFEVTLLTSSGPVSQISPTTLEYRTSLVNNQCDYREITLRKIDRSASATITGVVVDSNSLPVPDLFIRLYPAISNQDVFIFDYETAKTDKTGKYAFREIKPGQYVLGINLGSMPDFKAPYPQTFFPGVSALKDARVITVNENQNVSLEAFKLPPKLVEKRVTGKLVWPDGTPVNKLGPNSAPAQKPILYLIYLNNIKRGGMDSYKPDGTDTIQIDENGNFSLIAFEGYEYVIHAHAFNSQNEPLHARHIILNLKDSINPINLVLRIPGIGKGEREIQKELLDQSFKKDARK